MSRVKIRKALETHLAALTPAWPTQWQNQQFDVESEVEDADPGWQRATILFSETDSVGVGPNVPKLWQGTYQIDIFARPNKGPGIADARAEAVRAHFPRGRNLTADGIAVTILEPYDGNEQVEPKWFSVPVKIPFFAVTT